MGKCFAPEPASKVKECHCRETGGCFLLSARGRRRRLVCTSVATIIQDSLTIVGLEPIYVSEIVEQTMNPTFRHVDWSPCGPGITRMDRLRVRFWVKSAKVVSWRLLLEDSLCLRGLQYLGKSVSLCHLS